jgi:uncharacterized protein
VIPTEFTPLPAAFGGALIGVATVILMLTTGRIAGVSLYLVRLLPPWTEKLVATRFAFVAGLILAPVLYTTLSGSTISHTLTTGPLMLAAGGLLAGFGTVIGNGCTSGHGVCGLARISRRSLAATATFMASGLVTVFVLRHVAVW